MCVSRRLKWEISSQDPRLQPEQPYFDLTMENRLTYDAQRRQNPYSAIKNYISEEHSPIKENVHDVKCYMQHCSNSSVFSYLQIRNTF